MSAPARSSASSVAWCRVPPSPSTIGLDQRRPVQVVDVVERRAGRDQLPHHAVVAEVGGGDQRGAVVAAGDELRARAQPRAGSRASPRRRRPRRWSPRRSGRSRTRPVSAPALSQRLHRAALARERRHVQRRAAVGVARFQRRLAAGGERARSPARRRARRRRAAPCRRAASAAVGGTCATAGSGQPAPAPPARSAQAQRGHFSRSLTLSSAAIAHCSSRWPPGAPPTPTRADDLVADLDRHAAAEQQEAGDVAQVRGAPGSSA